MIKNRNMKYREKMKVVTLIKRYRRNLVNLKFTYKNVHKLTQMILNIKDLMEEYNPERGENEGLQHVILTVENELRELFNATNHEDIRVKFNATHWSFNHDLVFCLLVFGAFTIES